MDLSALQAGAEAVATAHTTPGLLLPFLLGFLAAAALIGLALWSRHDFDRRHARLEASAKLAGADAAELRRILGQARPPFYLVVVVVCVCTRVRAHR